MDKFNILNYLAGLTGYVFDKDVLTRIAYDCGVADVISYTELTQERKDRCKIALLETLLYSPHSSASQMNKHGEYQTQIGSQTLTAATLANIKAELKRLYKKYGEDESAAQVDASEATLRWI